MSAADWATAACVAIFVCVVIAMVVDLRVTKQKLRNNDGAVAGLRMDLDAARSRIAELQGYLSDYESWQPTPSQPVPPRLADRAVPDRWAAPPSSPTAPPSSPTAPPTRATAPPTRATAPSSSATDETVPLAE